MYDARSTVALLLSIAGLQPLVTVLQQTASLQAAHPAVSSPCDQLQLPLMQHAILALPVLVIPRHS
jgi:hypothetical protein